MIGSRAHVGAALAVAALATAAGPASGQLAVEIRAGAAVGNYTETDAGLDLLPQLSVGATAELRFTDLLSGYVGLNRSTFGCEEGFCAGRDVALTSQGLTAGARLTPTFPFDPWLRAGLALQALRVVSDAQNETSDLGVGWDLAVGIELPVGRRIALRPGVTYLRHGAATQQGDGHVALLAGEVGVRIPLGGGR